MPGIKNQKIKLALRYLFLLMAAGAGIWMLSGCTPSLDKRVPKTEKVIARDTLEDIVKDLALMEAYLNKIHKTPEAKKSIATELYLGILSKHGVSRERLDSTFAYYRDHMEDLKAIFDTAYHKILRMQTDTVNMPDSTIQQQ